MAARRIDGKAEAAALRQELAASVRALHVERSVLPALRVILVGEHPASMAYVRTKEMMAAEIGMDSAILRRPASITQAELLADIVALNQDAQIHGILVQLPLPDHIDERAVLQAIDPAKDVDGFHPLNVGRLFAGQGQLAPDLLVPCTPYGCLRLLERTLGAGGLRGMEAVIVGRSNIVGKPMAALLLSADCTVTVAHSRTRDLPEVCRRADIVVAAVGRPEMVRGDWLKPGACIIDVGINRIEAMEPGGKSRLVGDVAFDEAVGHVGAITPVPGGVGPMTVACLLRNTLIATRNQMAV